MGRSVFGGKHSVFWRVAGALIAVQLATGMLAIGLSAYLASDRSADLAENGLRVRLDALAEEIERATIFDTGDELSLSPVLEANLAFRFPDPIVIVNQIGEPVEIIFPDPDVFSGPVADSLSEPEIPARVSAQLEAGDIIVDRASDDVEGGIAIVPLFAPSGLVGGGFVIQPIERTMLRELAPTRAAFQTALISVLIVSIVIAIILATIFTWWLVRPLKRITSRVVEIGAGNYAARMEVSGADEIAQLGKTINEMAEHVEASVEALQTTDRMRRELVANVGHDLRTPLAAIKGHIEEAIRFEEENRPEDAVGAIRSASNQIEYLQNLVDDLFELSQLENPSPSLRSEPVPIAELISDVTRGHVHQATAEQISISIQVESELPIIEADGVRLKRLLDNLISNARRHTPAGGTIAIEARRDGTDLEILVRDSGEGMNESSIGQIFDRYYRGDSSRTRDKHGTGLGLAISKAVAELHGGSLTADSSLGKGTTMSVRLPISQIDGE